jgi:hypothetical protein
MNEICTEKIEERLCNSDVDLFGKSRNGNVCNGNEMEETINFYLKIGNSNGPNENAPSIHSPTLLSLDKRKNLTSLKGVLSRECFFAF